MAAHVAWIGLGSNQRGDLASPAVQLDRALAGLDAETNVRRLATSGYYRTAPVGGPPDQPHFCNACAALTTSDSALAVLDRLQRIENAQGRRRHRRWGPRTLDLDLLAFDDMVLDHPRLRLPHPRVHERAFVLVPLAEIAPALELAGVGRVGDALRRADCSGVRPWHARA